MTIQTTDEVYFLVRTGVWDQSKLEDWCQRRMIEHQDDTFELGHKEGFKEGIAEAKHSMSNRSNNGYDWEY